MRVVLIASGSGGHLVPALALAEYLRGPDHCTIVSTTRPVEKSLAANATETWVQVDLKPFTPFWRWLNPSFTLSQLSAVREVWRLFRRLQPEVVVGFGGYLSAVGILAGRFMKLPTLVHEQNILPGKANRIVSRFANAVAVSFPKTGSYFRRRQGVEVTGNPVRSRLRERIKTETARKSFGLDSHRRVLMVMGGSQGSRAINEAVIRMWEAQSPETRRRFQVLHLAGADHAAQVQGEYKRLGMKVKVFPFLHEMERAFAASSVVISRAGATTLSELAAVRRPSVLIPYPHAGGHQKANADWMRETGAAVVIRQEEISAQNLWDQVHPLISNPDKLDRMRQALSSYNGACAAEQLGKLVRKVAAR